MTDQGSEATKARIFEAAFEEFAAYGIAGARVDRIARNAQANKQLIYAYFGDKQQLFHAVLDTALVPTAEMAAAEMTDLDRWVDDHIDYHTQHPELLRLLMWEALEAVGEDSRRSGVRAERYALKKRKLAEAQQRGPIRSDIPPAYLLMLMMGMVNSALAMPRARCLILGAGHDPEELRAWMKDAIKRVAAWGAAMRNAS